MGKVEIIKKFIKDHIEYTHCTNCFFLNECDPEFWGDANSEKGDGVCNKFLTELLLTTHEKKEWVKLSESRTEKGTWKVKVRVTHETIAPQIYTIEYMNLGKLIEWQKVNHKTP